MSEIFSWSKLTFSTFINCRLTLTYNLEIDKEPSVGECDSHLTCLFYLRHVSVIENLITSFLLSIDIIYITKYTKYKTLIYTILYTYILFLIYKSYLDTNYEPS